MKLKDKTAIISGGSRGIGGACVELFAEECANVVIGDVLEAEGKALADKLGDKVVFKRLDVTQEESWADAVATAEAQFGGVDILVNCAGILTFNHVADLTAEEVRKTLDINLYGTIIGTQAVIPPMRKRGAGSIVNISSTDGLIGSNAHAAYIASKWGVRGFTKAAALELGLENIRVNSIHPGGVDTPLANPMNEEREEYNKRFVTFAAQRACDPTEIAQGVLFFASDDGSYCMGSELAIDGGLTAGLYYYGHPGAPDIKFG